MITSLKVIPDPMWPAPPRIARCYLDFPRLGKVIIYEEGLQGEMIEMIRFTGEAPYWYIDHFQVFQAHKWPTIYYGARSNARSIL